MTTDEIKKWLKGTGQNRDWLAEKLHATRGTVDQWFSRGFPAAPTAMIEMLIAGRGTSGLKVSFTPDEWSEIDQAMTNAGYTSQESFFHDGILCFAAQLETKEKGAEGKVVGMIQPPSPLARVAEQPG